MDTWEVGQKGDHRVTAEVAAKSTSEQYLRLLLDLPADPPREADAGYLGQHRLRTTLPVSDIFISYAKEDRERARVLAEALEGLGWSVWWDRIIPTGEVFAAVIQEAIDAAKCVVVLWSSDSVPSEWVAKEARRARKQEKLFPVLIDDVEPPWEFEELHACDLVDWDGRSTTGNFPLLVGDMGRILGTLPKQENEEKRRAEAEARRKANAEAKRRAEEEVRREADATAARQKAEGEEKRRQEEAEATRRVEDEDAGSVDVETKETVETKEKPQPVGVDAGSRPVEAEKQRWEAREKSQWRLQIWATSGVVITALFVLHTWGNLKLYRGPERFNSYYYWLGSDFVGLLWIARVALLAAAAMHILSAYRLTVDGEEVTLTHHFQNRVRRIYKSRLTQVCAAAIVLFVLFHLAHFTFGFSWAHPDFLVDDPYYNVVAGFMLWWVSGLHMVALVALGLYLHEVQSPILQVLGWGVPPKAAQILVWVVTVANISIPVAVLTGVLG